mgnify:FL=1
MTGGIGLTALQKQKKIQSELFFAEVLDRIAAGKHPRLLPRGSSMRPFIRGDKDKIVLSQLTEASYAVGRIVLVHLDRGYLIHRITRIDGPVYTLRGDGNPYQREQCTRDQILAEVTVVIRGKREILLGSKLWKRYERFWPANDTLRRLFLALYRRTLYRWGF